MKISKENAAKIRNAEPKIIMKFIAITLLFFYSCTGRVNDESAMISGTIVYYNNGDTIKSESIPKEIMKDIKEIRSGGSEPTECKPTGSVFFYKDHKVVDKIEFSTNATGADSGCQMVLSQNNGWRLTYRTGMFIDETFYSLKNKNE